MLAHMIYLYLMVQFLLHKLTYKSTHTSEATRTCIEIAYAPVIRGIILEVAFPHMLQKGGMFVKSFPYTVV